MDRLRRNLLEGLGLVLAGLAAGPVLAQAPKTIVVASTTSAEQSGLFTYLLPLFTEKTGITVKVVAVGAVQALDAALRGEADVVFVDDKPAEERFLAEGFATRRQEVMYNDFVLVGPASDPAEARGKDVLEGLRRIAAAKAAFISQGGRSDSNEAELRYWKQAGLNLATIKGEWYRDMGSSQGPVLNAASASSAYCLIDRGTWIAFENRGDLGIVVEGDPRLFNQYGVMLVNPAKHPQVKAEAGQIFIDWLVSPEGQRAIAGYKIGGEQLFFPNADPTGKL